MAYFKNTARTSVIIYLHDFVAACLAIYIVFCLFYFDLDKINIYQYLIKNMAIFSLLFLGGSSFTRLHEEPWIPFSYHHLRILGHTIGITILLYVPLFLVTGEEINTKFFFFCFILVFVFSLLTAGPRYLFSRYKDQNLKTKIKNQFGEQAPIHIPVVLVGLNEKSNRFTMSWFDCRTSNNEICEPVGIISLDVWEKENHFNHCPMLGTIDDLDHLIEKVHQRGHDLKYIVITQDQMSRSVYNDLLILTQKHQLKLLKLGDFSNNYLELDPVSIADIIGSLPDLGHNDNLKTNLRNKTVVIVGGAGKLGTQIIDEICCQSVGKIVVLDSCEYALYELDQYLSHKFPFVEKELVLCDVTDENHVGSIFERILPHIVIHRTFSKGQNSFGSGLEKFIHNNVLATLNLAQACQNYNVQKMLFVSEKYTVFQHPLVKLINSFLEQLIVYYDCEKVLATTRFTVLKLCTLWQEKSGVISYFTNALNDGKSFEHSALNQSYHFMSRTESVKAILNLLNHNDKTLERGNILAATCKSPISGAQLQEFLKLLMSSDDKDTVEEKISDSQNQHNTFDDFMNHSQEEDLTNFEIIFERIASCFKDPLPTKMNHIIQFKPCGIEKIISKDFIVKLKILVNSKLFDQAVALMAQIYDCSIIYDIRSIDNIVESVDTNLDYIPDVLYQKTQQSLEQQYY